MYVQPVQCTLLRNFNSLHPVTLPNGITISVPVSFSHCGGAPSLHDLQVDELKEYVKLVSNPVEVFRFDFSKRNALKTFESSVKEVTALEDGTVDAFVMWWELEMDPQGEIILSCAPSWAKAQPVPWRDHWMQALYYPSTPLTVKQNEKFEIHSCHDEYSLWFDTVKPSSSRPVCTCGLHVTFSRGRLGQMNDTKRNSIFIEVLQKHISSSTVCLVISDGSLLPLISAVLGAKKVFYLDTNSSCLKIIKQVLEANNLQDRVTILKRDEELMATDFENLKIDLVIAEPYFQASHLPWENLYFWYALTNLKPHLSQDVVVLPKSLSIWTMAVQFRDLHKIRAPVGTCEGFDITAFDKLIEESSDMADEEIEPQPLWEYPSVALCQPVSVAKIHFDQPVETMSSRQQTAELTCTKPGCMNGVALWTEFDFGDGQVVSCGPVGQDNRWDLYTRQGVRLLRMGKNLLPGDKIQVASTFSPSDGNFAFSFT